MTVMDFLSLWEEVFIILAKDIKYFGISEFNLSSFRFAGNWGRGKRERHSLDVNDYIRYLHFHSEMFFKDSKK